MKSEVEIAKEVLDGKWSTGDERKKLLSAAGYDYAQVQAYVNLMVKTGKPIKEITVSKKDIAGLVVNIEV